MFVTTPYSQVIALDAATGDLFWRYKRALPEGFSALHNTNRGVALYGDKVYFAPLDAVMVALDAKTGKVAWEAKIEDWKQGYYTTMAPLVVKGKVLIGVAGGEFGVRGFVQAFDAQTGKSVWKTYTIPAPASLAVTLGRRPTLGRPAAPPPDDRQLRSRDQHGLLGHRQRLAVVWRSAAGRQFVHLFDGRARWRHRQNQGPFPVPSERILGTGTR